MTLSLYVPDDGPVEPRRIHDDQSPDYTLSFEWRGQEVLRYRGLNHADAARFLAALRLHIVGSALVVRSGGKSVALRPNRPPLKLCNPSLAIGD